MGGPTLQRGLAYFALVFGAGFVLGPIRVLLLEPRLGARSAELIEAPVMLAVIVVAARFTLRRWPAGVRDALISGALALLLTVAVELVVVLRLRGLSLDEYLDQRDDAALAVYLINLALFGLMPAVFSGRPRDRV